MKAQIKIEDSKGTRIDVKNFRGPQAAQDYRLALKGRVETGATITVTPV